MRQFIRTCLLLSSFSTFLITNVHAALPISPWYLSLSGGIFQGNFDMTYNDLTDTIPQNIRQQVQQYGYSGGIGIGYNRIYADQYLLGGELSGNLYSSNANFASGASTTAFSDQITINRNADLTFIPGLILNEKTAVYAKAGVSYAHVKSSLSSPSGFTPSYIQNSGTANVFGVALGLGAKRRVSKHMGIFAEYLYHNYRNINFPYFQNFSATYSHAAKLNTMNIAVGINYYF